MRMLRALLRVIVIVACVIGIILVGRSLVANVNAFTAALAVNQRYTAARAAFPGTATAINNANATLAIERTYQPTNTPTSTPSPEPTEPAVQPDDATSDGPVIGGPPMLDPTITPAPAGRNADQSQQAAKFVAYQIVTATLAAPPTAGPLATNTPRAVAATATPPAPGSTAAPVASTGADSGNATLKAPSVPLLLIPTVARPQQTAIPTAAPRQRANNFDILNIILIGSDQDVDPSDRSYRTDSMLVVSINRTTNSVSMLSLPRDLYVYIPTLGMQRLNTAYNWGESVNFQPGRGFGLLQQTVLYNFGIPLHYYARISLNGFKTIVDSLNGIDIAVDCPISDLRYQGPVSERTPEPSEYTPFTLNPGYYHMNGSLSLWYARVRKSTSDFDRSRRQQQVLRALWKTAREQNLAAKVPELWGPMTSVLDTNLTLPDALSLLPVALSLKPGDIRSYYMQKGYELQHFAADGADVQIPLLPGFFETINRFYTPPTANKTGSETLSIDVINGTDNKDLDKVAVDRLLWGGFAATAKGEGGIVPKTTIYDYTGSSNPATLTALLKALNAKPNQVESQPDPNRTVDFKIVLGADYNSCSAAGFTK
jgi:LCP family protein required for cell wall assembly